MSEAQDIKENTMNVIKIGSNDVVMWDCFKGPIVINGPVQSQVNTSSSLVSPSANDHEASSSKPDPKYNQPRWCPDGLTHTQMRKQQEQELEK